MQTNKYCEKDTPKQNSSSAIMDLNDTELRQPETNDNINKSESAETDDTTEEAANAAQKMTVIQTKDKFYDALRIWVQQYQLQQMAYMCFPYYLSSNMPTPDGPSIHPSFLAASQRYCFVLWSSHTHTQNIW